MNPVCLIQAGLTLLQPQAIGLPSSPWISVENPPTDAAQLGFDINRCDFSQLPAIPAKGGHSVAFGSLKNPDFFPALIDGYSPVSVYSKFQNYYLIHCETGWYWVYCQESDSPPGLYMKYKDGIHDIYKKLLSTYDVMASEPHSNIKNICHYDSIRMIEPQTTELLYSKPDTSSSNFGKLNGQYFKILIFDGDWVRVQETMDPSFNPPEGSVAPLEVRWNPDREGWIRWRVPGPVRGSFRVLLRGTRDFTNPD
jgi:hypothetical protein